jgi:hypothetical protein
MAKAYTRIACTVGATIRDLSRTPFEPLPIKFAELLDTLSRKEITGCRETAKEEAPRPERSREAS